MVTTRIHKRTDATQGFLEGEAEHSRTSAAFRRNASSEFVAVLDRSGLHDALGYLNGRTRFRFTGVYRFESSVLINECLYDRENPSLDQSGGIQQLPDTYCSIVRATGDVFATGNAPTDPRLEGHSARHTVISYSGVPIRMPSGRIAGVLCHYDLRPRLLPAEERKILETVAPHLVDRLRTSPQASAPKKLR